MTNSHPEPLATNKAGRRLDRRDPRLPLAELFDPAVARGLWDALPPEYQLKSFTNATMPAQYVGAVRPRNAGPSSGERTYTSTAINMTGLPETMVWEMAWLIHREVELGRTVDPLHYRCTILVLRAATAKGTARGRQASSLLTLTPTEWLREAQAARLRGAQLGPSADDHARATLKRLQDILCYAYHRGAWWELDVWNPMLDARIPQREHEPQGRHVANFSHLTSRWLRDGAKWWLSTMLETERYSWSTIKTRLDGLKWLQRHIDNIGDAGPTLTTDPDDLRTFFRTLAAAMREHRVLHGRTKGQPLGKTVRRQTINTIEAFYRHMYDHRAEAAKALSEDRWLSLKPEHTVPFRPEDKPRQVNRPPDDKVLEDEVVSQIASRADLLALPRDEGGLGDVQAFHALALLVRTGRRLNEILMMDFDPLLPLVGASPDEQDGANGALVARLRYQLTKINAADAAPTIPVDEEIVRIVRAQQAVAREIVAANGVETEPRYLFLRKQVNRRGQFPYSAATLSARLSELADRLDIRDSQGRRVSISQTHQFRHTKATSLLNAGVPLHVVMRYFGHVTPSMTMHYAKTLSQTAEREFLRYQKVTADGRTLEIDASDLFDLLHLEQRADRVLPNGWCMLPPRQACDRGNACLSCSMFTTDESHRPELEQQLGDTERLIRRRQQAFETKNGCPMPEDNVWLKARRSEQTALRQVLIALDEIKMRPGTAVQGAGASDRAKEA